MNNIDKIRKAFSDKSMRLALLKQLTVIDKDGNYLQLSDLKPQQEITIDHLFNNDSLVILKARQVGISTIIVAVWFLDWLLDENPINIVLLPHKQLVANELLSKAKLMYQSLPSFLKKIFPIKITNSKLINIKTGATFQARSAKEDGGLRSGSCQKLLLSELNHTEKPDELLAASISALNKGQLVIESTALYYDDILMREFIKAQNKETNRTALFFPWSLEPSYNLSPPPDFLPVSKILTPSQEYWMKIKKAELGPAFEREYPLTFEEAYAQLPGSFIEDSELEYLDIHKCGKDKANYFEEYNPEHTYAIGVDPAYGAGGDYTSIQVLNLNTLNIAASYHSNYCKIPGMVDQIARFSNHFGKAIVNIEINTEGFYTIEQLQKLQIPIYYWGNKPGWITKSTNKAELFETIRYFIENKKLRSVDELTYLDLRSVRFENTDSLSVVRSNGSHFDFGISLAMVLLVAKYHKVKPKISTPEPGKFIVKRPASYHRKQR